MISKVNNFFVTEEGKFTKPAKGLLGGAVGLGALIAAIAATALLSHYISIPGVSALLQNVSPLTSGIVLAGGTTLFASAIVALGWNARRQRAVREEDFEKMTPADGSSAPSVPRDLSPPPSSGSLSAEGRKDMRLAATAILMAKMHKQGKPVWEEELSQAGSVGGEQKPDCGMEISQETAACTIQRAFRHHREVKESEKRKALPPSPPAPLYKKGKWRNLMPLSPWQIQLTSTRAARDSYYLSQLQQGQYMFVPENDPKDEEHARFTCYVKRRWIDTDEVRETAAREQAMTRSARKPYQTDKIRGVDPKRKKELHDEHNEYYKLVEPEPFPKGRVF